MNISLEERFWRHVNKDGPVPPHVPELGQCWVWTASCRAGGYGSFRMASYQSGGKTRSAHVVAWELENGSTGGLFVLHKCDNRRCVRPDHLFLGTHQDNRDDCVKKGRAVSPPRLVGDECPWAKLDRNHAMAILFLKHHSSFTQKQIADQFGVNQALVSMIYTGKAWPDLRRPPIVVPCDP